MEPGVWYAENFIKDSCYTLATLSEIRKIYLVSSASCRTLLITLQKHHFAHNH